MSRIVFPPDYGPAIPSAGDMVPAQTVGGVLVPDPGVPLTAWQDPAALSVQTMFKRHPSVAKVTTFIAANIASIPLHVYRLEGETDRVRVRDGALAELIKTPSSSPGMSWFRFWQAVIMDGLIFDRACVHVQQGDTIELVRIPPGLWRHSLDGLGRVSDLQLANSDGKWESVDPADFLIDLGYTARQFGSTPLETLRVPVEDYLAEATYRRDLWSKGPRFGGIVSRDQKWPNKEARSRFLTGLSQFNRVGERAGTVMLLDDGMKWNDVQGISPKDVASIDARQYTDVEVAAAFHIAPELVGARQGTFANLEAFRQSLWSINLGPYITQWELMVAPLVDMLGGPGEYIEANVQAKLRGSFEEQAVQLQTSVGAPWMTRNEARARVNMPAVDGGDELITPLNVTEGGQASPRDSAPPPKARAPQGRKDEGADDADRSDVEDVLRRFWRKQERDVLPEIESGTTTWWDKARWDKELAADLLDAALALSAATGREAAKQLGESPTSYSVARTVAYLTKVSEHRAEWINDTTHDQLLTAIGDEGDPAHVFETARSGRAGAAAGALTAGVVAFAKTEAAKQTGHAGATKTWVVTSGNPRASHAAMDGETVPVGENFSNGMKWPGDPAGGADEVAGCQCGVDINTP